MGDRAARGCKEMEVIVVGGRRREGEGVGVGREDQL